MVKISNDLIIDLWLSPPQIERDMTLLRVTDSEMARLLDTKINIIINIMKII